MQLLLEVTHTIPTDIATRERTKIARALVCALHMVCHIAARFRQVLASTTPALHTPRIVSAAGMIRECILGRVHLSVLVSVSIYFFSFIECQRCALGLCYDKHIVVLA